MTHYHTSYKGMDRKQADSKAIADIMEWWGNGEKAFLLFGDMVQYATHVEQAIKSDEGRVLTFQSLNMMFGMSGVSGYPFHAFCRRWCPNKYREWMTTGPDAVELDEEGFTITNIQPKDMEEAERNMETE